MDASVRRGASRALVAVRSPRAAATLMIALVLATPTLYVLWSTTPATTVTQSRFDPDGSPFPIVPARPLLHVVPVGPQVNESMRLALLSLQGLVNRGGAEVYLDFENETSDPGSILSFLRTRYSVATDAVSVDWFLDTYLGRAGGLVVYDPQRLESVNIATTFAGTRNAVIAGPDLAPNLTARSGLLTLFDYRASDWTSLDAIGAYDRAMRELYPQSNHDLLAILPPDKLALRDYLVASRTFVFYEPQGVLATPFEIASTRRILHATPRGIPILGWFHSPTLTEENAFVQLASGEGKFLLGTEDTPNLSVLTAFGRNTTFTQPSSPVGNLTVQDKVYAVVAIADGDNLDFVAHRMRELWADPARGNLPVAWSVDPLLADLAPPYLEYYYGAAASTDRFIAGPSGAGYLYPDYTGPDDLPNFLRFSRRYFEQTDLDVPWILNAFTASEISHGAASLSAYIDELRPRGIALDYADQPGTADYWVQHGTAGASPVIRSTHLWTSKENFLAKAQAALGARQGTPYFLWMTVYPWRFNLTDAKDTLEELARRTGQPVEVVTPERFFDLMVQDFLDRARRDLASMESDPLASTLLRGHLDIARAHLLESEWEAARGRAQEATYEAYLTSETLRDAMLREDLLVVSAFLVGLAAVQVYRLRRRFLGVRTASSDAVVLVSGVSVVALFLFDVQAVLRDNFWTDLYILAGLAVSGFASPLLAFLERVYPRRASAAAFLLFAVASSMTFWTSAGFPLSALTGTVALRVVLRERPHSPRLLLLVVFGGIAVGLFLPVTPIAFGGFAAVLLASAALRRPTEAPPVRGSPARKGAWTLAFATLLPLVGLAASHSFSVALRLELQGQALVILGIALVAAVPLVVLPLTAWVPRGTERSFALRALLVGALFSAGLLFVSASVTATLMLFGASVGYGLAAWGLLSDDSIRGGGLERTAGPLLSLLAIILLFIRLPPVAYSLLLGPLPWAVEYALYAPPVLWVLVAMGLGGAVLLRISRPTTRKGL